MERDREREASELTVVAGAASEPPEELL